MSRATLLPSALLFVLFTTLAVSACKPQGGAAPGGAMGGPGGMPPPEVEVITVAPQTVSRTVEIPGRLAAVRTAQVRARVEGILEKREYVEGSEVKAGQVLFRIDARTLAAHVETAKAALARAQATALIAAQNLERMQALKDTKAISRQEFDQAQAAKTQADADVASAHAALNRAEIDLSYTTVTAPIAGRVGRALVTEGALVGKGEATPLATIEQYDPIWVDFSQSSAEFMQMRQSLKQAAHAPVRLVLENSMENSPENAREYARPGRLLFNDLAVDPATGTVGMRAEFANPARDLLPGQFVTVRLPVTRAQPAIVIPQRAVQVSPEGQVVMLVGADGKVMPLPVKTGGLAGTNWIILSGLKGGEQVIVNGLQKARPGMTVKAVRGKG